jgi:hypothetical protein
MIIYPILGVDLRISAAHGSDFWEPILRPTLRGQPELLTGRWVKILVLRACSHLGRRFA